MNAETISTIAAAVTAIDMCFDDEDRAEVLARSEGAASVLIGAYGSSPDEVRAALVAAMREEGGVWNWSELRDAADAIEGGHGCDDSPTIEALEDAGFGFFDGLPAYGERIDEDGVDELMMQDPALVHVAAV